MNSPFQREAGATTPSTLKCPHMEVASHSSICITLSYEILIWMLDKFLASGLCMYIKDYVNSKWRFTFQRVSDHSSSGRFSFLYAIKNALSNGEARLRVTLLWVFQVGTIQYHWGKILFSWHFAGKEPVNLNPGLLNMSYLMIFAAFARISASSSKSLSVRESFKGPMACYFMDALL